MKEKILVALSGGVDSLSAALLLQESYEIIGLHILMHEDDKTSNELTETCKRCGIKLFEADATQDFRTKVEDYFTESYISGSTPNICAHCNAVLKFPSLLSFADKLGIEKIATGHYAYIIRNGVRFLIRQAADSWKDQSYMLYRLGQDVLSRLVLPLGGLTKTQVKALAAQNGLTDVANARESYGICFTKGMNYGDYLLKQHPELGNLQGGTVIDQSGKPIGSHKGYPFYTLGQFRGLDLGEKLYVCSIDPKSNTLCVGEKASCFSSSVKTDFPIVHQAERIAKGETFLIKIRGKDQGTLGRVSLWDEGKQDAQHAVVEFAKPVFAPMRGQDVVAYSEDGTIAFGAKIA